MGNIMIWRMFYKAKYDASDHIRTVKKCRAKKLNLIKKDFETRVASKDFDVGDVVFVDTQYLPDMKFNPCNGAGKIQRYRPEEYITETTQCKIESIKEICGVKFARIKYLRHEENVMEYAECKREAVHIIVEYYSLLPFGAFTAKWSDNKSIYEELMNGPY